MVNKLNTRPACWIRWILLSSFVLFPNLASAELFGGDDKKWEQLFLQIKKINSRLVDLDNVKLIAMESLQKDAVRQIEELKNIFPGFQGALNDNRMGIEQNAQILKNTLDRMASLETQLNNKIDNLSASVTNRLENQNSANDLFRKDLVEKLKQLKEGMSVDFENLNRNSSQNFQGLSKSNQEVLGQIVASLNEQNQKVAEGQTRMDSLVKNDLIPALSQEGNNNRTTLLADLEKLRASIEEALKAHQAGLLANRQDIQTNLKQVTDLGTGVKDWNEKLVGILKQNLEINTTTRDKVGVMEKGLDETGKTMASVNGQFKQVADTVNKLNSQSQSSGNALLVIQTGVANLESAGKLSDKKVDQLLLTSGEMIKHELAMESTVSDNRAQLALSNEKLTKLIEILKTIAQEQSSLQKVVQNNDSGILLKEISGQVKGLSDSTLETSNKILQSQNQLVSAQNQLAVESQKSRDELLQKQNALTETSKLVLQSQNELVASQNALLQASQQGMDQLLQEQTALGETNKLVLKSQNELVASQNELLKQSQAGGSGGFGSAQTKEIIERLVDLRNKGNLNISINQDIQKTLKAMEAKP